MYKRQLLSILFLINSVIAYSQEKEWSYQQCVEYAIENNLLVKLQNYDVDERTEEYRQARSQWIPNVNGFYTHSFNRGLTIDPFTNISSQENINTGNIGAQVQVPLVTGRKIWNRVKQSKTSIESSELGKKKMENDILLQVTENFLDAIFKYENIGISEQRVKTLTEQVDRTKRLVDAGSVPLAELLDLLSQKADTDRQLTEAENAYSIAILTLKQSMQLDFNTPFDIVIPELADPDTAMVFQNSNDVYLTSQVIMPEILQADRDIAISVFQRKIAKGDYYPSLSFNGNVTSSYSSSFYNPIDPTDNSLKTQLENGFRQVAAIQLTIPIYNNRNIKTQVNKAKIAITKSEVQKEQRLNELRINIEQAYINAISAQKTYISSKKSVESLIEQFRSVNKRFTSGAASTTDYVVAENNLNIAKAELNRAKYQFIFSRKILDFYEGREIIIE